MRLPSGFALWNVLFMGIPAIPLTAYLLTESLIWLVIAFALNGIISVCLGLIIWFYSDMILELGKSGVESLSWRRK